MCTVRNMSTDMIWYLTNCCIVIVIIVVAFMCVLYLNSK